VLPTIDETCDRCKKFKFWEHDKCVVWATMPSGEEKKFKPDEKLGATYGPMLEKMRLEVKNKAGLFMATTARTAESRSAAPLPSPEELGGNACHIHYANMQFWFLKKLTTRKIKHQVAAADEAEAEAEAEAARREGRGDEAAAGEAAAAAAADVARRRDRRRPGRARTRCCWRRRAAAPMPTSLRCCSSPAPTSIASVPKPNRPCSSPRSPATSASCAFCSAAAPIPTIGTQYCDQLFSCNRRIGFCKPIVVIIEVSLRCTSPL
jgi:hypothetical protein